MYFAQTRDATGTRAVAAEHLNGLRRVLTTHQTVTVHQQTRTISDNVVALSRAKIPMNSDASFAQILTTFLAVF